MQGPSPKDESCSPHGWTLDTLEIYLSEKITALGLFCKVNFDTADKALQKAEAAAEERFKSVNEFRSTLSDQATNLLPRAEYQIQIAAMTERISLLSTEVSDMKSNIQGKNEGIGNIGSLIMGVAVVISSITSAIAIVLVIFHH